MNIEEIYQILVENSLGSQYYKADLHVHFDHGKMEFSTYIENLHNVFTKHKLKIICLTVHRQKDLDELFTGIEKLKELNEKKSVDITFFPSIEVKDSSNTHFSIIFNSDNKFSQSEIGNLLGALGRLTKQSNEDNKDQGDRLELSLSGDKDKLKKIFSEYKVIGFFPHPLIRDGVAKKISGESLEDYAKEPLTTLWNLGKPKLDIEDLEKDSNCPKTFTKTPQKYHDIKELREIARIKVSDSHDPNLMDEIYSVCPSCPLYDFCNVGISYLKLSERNITGLKQIEYDFETRVKIRIENVRNHPYIIGFYVDGEFFQDKFFRFNPELNVLIGGRGTGKSLIIDLIRFGFSYITNDKECLDIFRSKIFEQLGHQGKVILFFIDSEENIIGIKNVLLLSSDSKKIDFKEDIIKTYYKKYGDSPFLEIDKRDLEKSFQVEALSQTEIPRLHRKTSSLISIVDKFIKNFPEKLDRIQFITRINNLKDEYLNLYSEYDSLEESKIKKEGIEKKINNKLKHINTIKGLNLERYNSLISVNSKLEEQYLIISDWFENFQSNLDLKLNKNIFNDLDKIYLSEVEELIDNFKNMFTKILSFQQRVKNVFKNKENLISNKIDTLSKEWQDFFEKKYESYKKLLEKHDVDYLSQLQKDVTKLNKRVVELEEELKTYRTKKRKIRCKEIDLLNLGREITHKTDEIRQIRMGVVKEIEQKMKELNIVVNMKLKAFPKNLNESVFYQWLEKFHPGGDSNVLNFIHKEFLPYELAKFIINNKVEKLEERIPGKYYQIREKLKDLVVNSKTPKHYKEDLIDLLKTYIDSRPLISYKRPDLERYIPITHLSIGERCAILLYIMLLEEGIPFLIDQADAELDQESIKRFSKFLLDRKESRQIIVATHNPNIPTLGDVDLLYHLKTEPTGEREIGIVSNRGGFESCIDAIITLEGGKEAIKRRFNKYNEDFLKS